METAELSLSEAVTEADCRPALADAGRSTDSRTSVADGNLTQIPLPLLTSACDRCCIASQSGSETETTTDDQSVSRSIVVYQDTEDKLLLVDDNKLIAASGPAADRAHFLEYIEKNVALYALRAGHRLSTHATAAFTRNELAEAIRKGPFQVNCLIAGIDSTGPCLYWLDYLGSLHRVSSGGHGYGSYFALSLFDRFYHSSCSLDEGLQVMARIVQELRLRFLLKIGNIKCKAVTSDGVRELQLPQL